MISMTVYTVELGDEFVAGLLTWHNNSSSSIILFSLYAFSLYCYRVFSRSSFFGKTNISQRIVATTLVRCRIFDRSTLYCNFAQCSGERSLRISQGLAKILTRVCWLVFFD